MRPDGRELGGARPTILNIGTFAGAFFFCELTSKPKKCIFPL